MAQHQGNRVMVDGRDTRSGRTREEMPPAGRSAGRAERGRTDAQRSSTRSAQSRSTQSRERGGSHRQAPSQAQVILPKVLLAAGVFLLLAVIFLVLQVRSCNTIGDLEKEKADVSAQLTATQQTVSALEGQAGGGVVDPWVAGGYFTTGNNELDEKLKAYIDQYVDDNKTYEENAYYVYNRICQSDYVERDDNQHPQGIAWRETYAIQYLDAGASGNCYNFTAITSYMFQYFGYNAIAEPCEIKKQSGAWGDHGLVFLKIDGKDVMCDCARGSNGWMLDPESYTYNVMDIGQHPNG